MSCISRVPLELDVFKFPLRDALFFHGALLPEGNKHTQAGGVLSKAPLTDIPRAVTELSGTGKGTESHNPHAEHPLSGT